MDEEERRLRIEATKVAMREWLTEEKERTYKKIGEFFINALAVAIYDGIVRAEK